MNYDDFIWHTWVKTGVADDHDRHGTRTMGLGQFVAVSEAICNDKTNLYKTKLHLKSLFTHRKLMHLSSPAWKIKH
jgi:hypothetical protein